MVAPFVPNPNVLEVAVNQRLFNRPITNVLYWDLEYVPTAGDVHEVADAFANAWGEHMLPLLVDQLFTVGVRVRSLASQASPQVEYQYPVPLGGHKALGVMSANNAVCLTHRTGLPGRSYRGRTYISGVPSAGLNGNYVAASWAEPLPGAFMGMVGSVTASVGGFHVVYSRRAGGAWRVTGLATPVIQTVLRNLKVDSQRRRSGKDV